MKYFVRAGLVIATLFLGCSDDREPIPDAGAPADARMADVRVTESGVSVDASMDAPGPTGPDGPIDLFDVFPIPDGGCPGCIRDRCGAQINGCINNPACAAGLLCTVQMCAGGLAGDSGFDPTNFACVLGCFNGDQNLAFMAIGSLICVTMTCGGPCNFLDAGTDARPNPDVQTPPDAGADVTGADASADGPGSETGSGTDAGENADGDGATPDDDAAEDAVGNDVTPETGDQLDTAPPTDVTPDALPPDEGGAD
jgi:hypothetical protein